MGFEGPIGLLSYSLWPLTCAFGFLQIPRNLGVQGSLKGKTIRSARKESFTDLLLLHSKREPMLPAFYTHIHTPTPHTPPPTHTHTSPDSLTEARAGGGQDRGGTERKLSGERRWTLPPRNPLSPRLSLY